MSIFIFKVEQMSIPMVRCICHFDLLIVIVKQTFPGSFRHFEWKVKLFGIRGIYGRITVSSLAHPVSMIASRRYLCSRCILNLFHYVKFGGFTLCSIMQCLIFYGREWGKRYGVKKVNWIIMNGFSRVAMVLIVQKLRDNHTAYCNPAKYNI